MNIVLQPRLTSGDARYQSMAEISRKSYERNLAGTWEYQDFWNHDWAGLWIETFRRCREHSKNGHNVFLVGVDTVAVRPIEVFDKYQQLMMFWYTDPPKRDPYVDGYMNSEPMYIPANLSDELWEIGRERVDEMKPADSHYDRIQEIWNDMFWSQKPVPDLDPYMNWSPQVWSTIREDDAKIIHYHASRNPEETLQKMRAKCG